MSKWNLYYEILSNSDVLKDRVDLPYIPEECKHNAHMFYIKTKDLNERTKLIAHLRNNGINAVFHYVPLHSAEAGSKFGRFSGEDKFTTKESERLLRLPLHYNLSQSDIEKVCDAVTSFYITNML